MRQADCWGQYSCAIAARTCVGMLQAEVNVGRIQYSCAHVASPGRARCMGKQNFLSILGFSCELRGIVDSRADFVYGFA